MAAPVTPPDFATDPAYPVDGSDWDGDPPRVDPGGTVRARGFEPGELLPAEHLNFMIGLHGDWLSYLYEGTLESSSKVLRLGAFAGEGGNATGASPAFKFEVFSTGGTEGQHLVSAINFAARHLQISDLIPSGADLTRVRAFVQPGAARGSGDAMILSVRTMSLNWNTPAAPTYVVDPGVDEDDGTTAYQVLDTGVISITNDRNLKQIYARMQCGNDAGTNEDKIIGWEITYTGAAVR